MNEFRCRPEYNVFQVTLREIKKKRSELRKNKNKILLYRHRKGNTPENAEEQDYINNW